MKHREGEDVSLSESYPLHCAINWLNFSSMMKDSGPGNII